MNPYELSAKARKHIASWSKADYYVYIRPTSSKHAESSKKEGQWWVVAVQIRHFPPHEFREEGRSLDECIRALGKRVPLRKDLPEITTSTLEVAFLAPWAQYKRYAEGIAGDATKSPLLKKAVADNKAKKKKAMSKDGRDGLLHDRYGPGRGPEASAKGSGKDSKKRKKKGKK